MSRESQELLDFFIDLANTALLDLQLEFSVQTRIPSMPVPVKDLLDEVSGDEWTYRNMRLRDKAWSLYRSLVWIHTGNELPKCFSESTNINLPLPQVAPENLLYTVAVMGHHLSVEYASTLNDLQRWFSAIGRKARQARENRPDTIMWRGKINKANDPLVHLCGCLMNCSYLVQQLQPVETETPSESDHVKNTKTEGDEVTEPEQVEPKPKGRNKATEIADEEIVSSLEAEEWEGGNANHDEELATAIAEFKQEAEATLKGIGKPLSTGEIASMIEDARAFSFDDQPISDDPPISKVSKTNRNHFWHLLRKAGCEPASIRDIWNDVLIKNQRASLGDANEVPLETGSNTVRTAINRHRQKLTESCIEV